MRENTAPVSAPPRESTHILDQVPQARQDPNWGSSSSSSSQTTASRFLQQQHARRAAVAPITPIGCNTRGRGVRVGDTLVFGEPDPASPMNKKTLNLLCMPTALSSRLTFPAAKKNNSRTTTVEVRRLHSCWGQMERLAGAVGL